MRHHVFVILLFAAVSCRDEAGVNNALSVIQLDSSVTHFVERFIEETHCDDALNSITIDKILPDSTIITVQTQPANKRYFVETLEEES